MFTLAPRQGLLLVLLLAALLRLPFLGAGYGVNVDAWRVADVARALAKTGEYEASRLPGYPLHEVVSSWCWQGGPWALNGLSALASLAAVWAFWQILRLCGSRDALWLAAAFSSVPVLLVNSVSSKDYVWALAFGMWALWAALKQRPWMCGLLLGLAIGCRMTSGALLLPLLLLCSGEAEGRGARMAKMAGTSLAVGAVCFLPVIGRYGMHFFTFYDSHARPDLGTVIARGTLDVWGLAGCLGVLIAWLASAHPKTRRTTGAPWPPGLAPALWLIIALYAIAYLRLPDQAGYLLPMVPAVLLLLARRAPAWALRALAVLLCAAPWIDLGKSGPAAGPILQDHWERQQTLSSVRQFIQFSESRLGRPTIVAVGGWEPIVRNLMRGDERNRYVYVLDAAQIAQAHAQGWQIAYASEGIRAFNIRVQHLDPAASGAIDVHALFTRGAR